MSRETEHLNFAPIPLLMRKLPLVDHPYRICFQLKAWWHLHLRIYMIRIKSLTNLPIDFLHPYSYIVEAFTICNIINYNYSMRSSVVACSESSETLLSCCVPLNDRWYKIKMPIKFWKIPNQNSLLFVAWLFLDLNWWF